MYENPQSQNLNTINQKGINGGLHEVPIVRYATIMVALRPAKTLIWKKQF